MSDHQPLRDPEQLTVRRVLGLDDLRAREMDSVSDAAEVTLDLDARMGKIERLFEDSESPDDAVVLQEEGKVLAHLTLSALGTQVLRVGPPASIREVILAWGERTGIYWCREGLHFTVRLPCPEHGG